MAFEFIQIPANGQGSAKEELNKLLRGGRIASVRKEFVSNGEGSFRAFCILSEQQHELLPCSNQQHGLPPGPQLRPQGMDFPAMSQSVTVSCSSLAATVIDCLSAIRSVLHHFLESLPLHLDCRYNRSLSSLSLTTIIS